MSWGEARSPTAAGAMARSAQMELEFLVERAQVGIPKGGRIRIPSRWHRAIGVEAHIVRDFTGRCLLSMPESTWLGIAQRFDAGAHIDEAAGRAARIFLSSSCLARVDRWGRITTSAWLRESVGLGHAGVPVGAGNRLEPWDERAWDDWRNAVLSGESVPPQWPVARVHTPVSADFETRRERVPRDGQQGVLEAR
jgi:MraZ protein